MPDDSAQPRVYWPRVGLTVGLCTVVALGMLQLGFWVADGREAMPWPLHSVLCNGALSLIICSWITMRGRGRAAEDRYGAGWSDGFSEGLAVSSRAAGNGRVTQMPPRGSMRS